MVRAELRPVLRKQASIRELQWEADKKEHAAALRANTRLLRRQRLRRRMQRRRDRRERESIASELREKYHLSLIHI